MADKLIAYWQGREHNTLIPLAFKAYKGTDGGLVQWVPAATSFDKLLRMPEGDGLEGELSRQQQVMSN